MDSNVVGATGQNGDNGQTLGASGTSGDPGGDAGADASSATDTTNTAEATGGQGGSGGNGAANTPTQGGGRAGNGGDGGKAVATAAVTAATADGNKATATATGGTGGGGGVGGAPSALGGVGGNGGGAKATATATNTDGAATATATATGGTGGESQYDTPGPYPGGYVGNVYASGNGANVAGSSATANGTTSATATVTQTGGYGAGGPAGGDGGSSTLTNAVSGTTDDGTLSLMQTAAGGGGGEGGFYAGRGASGGDATSDLTVDDTSSKLVSAEVFAEGGDGGAGLIAAGGATTIGPGGTGEASGTITGTSTVYDMVEASGGDGDVNGGTANATGTGTAGTLANVYVLADGGEANGLGGAANAVATGSAAQANVTANAYGGEGYQFGGAGTAQATATGQSGTATANAGTNYFNTADNTEDSLEVTSVAPVAGTSKAVAAISQGDTLGALDTTAQSISNAVLDPSAASNGTDFGTGDSLQLDTEQGGGNFASVTGDVTVTTTLEGHIDLSAYSPDSQLLLDLDNATLVGTGVTAVDISVQFSSQVTNQAFASGAAAEAYFSHDVIDIGTLSDLAEFSSSLTYTLVDIQISVSVDAPLSGFYANGQVAIEPAAAAAPDVFQEKDAATTGTFSGDYLWSNAGNWVGDQPAAGSNVEMAGVGVDDIARLSLVSLSVSPPSGNGTEGKLSVYDDLTVNVLTVAASSEIDIVGPAQLNVTGAATIDGTIVTDPSTLTVEGTVTGAGTIDIGAGSNVIFDGAVAATETVDFVSSTGTLTIADPADFAAQVVGSGTEIVICFLRGTRVATPRGEVPIETLARGDRLVTRFGGVRPIKWIGRQSFAAGFLTRNREQWPVRIAAGALGDARPARDLYVSPGHSMLIADRLILARNLVNGVTITQTPPSEDVHYYQVEFEAHDCILAEGAWSESYADAQGLRNRFHNAGEFRALFPDDISPAEPALCAPRPLGGPDLQAALAPIVARAAAGLAPGPLRGWVETIAPDGIVGWAQDAAHPEMPVLLDVWLHDRLLGRMVACEFRGDLADAGIGRGYCSFRLSIDVPAGSAPDLVVCRSADGAALPPTFALRAVLADRHDGAPEAPGPLRGWIDRIGPDRIDGWAQDVGHPGRPVRLEVWLRGTLLGTVVASGYRRDVEAAGIGGGYCGFSFPTLGGIVARHLTICRAADGAVVPMTAELRAKAA